MAGGQPLVGERRLRPVLEFSAIRNGGGRPQRVQESARDSGLAAAVRHQPPPVSGLCQLLYLGRQLIVVLLFRVRVSVQHSLRTAGRSAGRSPATGVVDVAQLDASVGGRRQRRSGPGHQRGNVAAALQLGRRHQWRQGRQKSSSLQR